MVSKKRNKILVECHHGIGDLVMTFPAIKEIRKKNPDSEIHMLVRNEQQKELMLDIGLVDKCYTYDIVTSGVRHLLYLVKAFKKENYSLAYALGQSPRGWDVLLIKLGGCKNIVSINHEHSLCGKYEKVDVGDCTHRINQHLKCVGGTKYKKGDQDWMPLSEDVYRTLQKKLPMNDNKTKIGICLGTGDFFYRKGFKKIFYNAKQWPIDRFIQLGKMLEDKGIKVIYFGGNKEKQYLKQLQICIPEQSYDMIGKLTLVESVEMLKKCDLVVGADTGMMHCAAAVGVNNLTIFGSTDEKVIGPYSKKSYFLVNNQCQCRPCWGKKDRTIINCKERKCLNDITEDVVYKKIMSIIKEKNE